MIVFFGAGCNSHHPEEGESPYVGQEGREIKSLTDREVQGYLNGEGMGLSKVAELNNFPGPKHVIELSDQLDLTEAQLSQTEMLFEEMKKHSTTLGQQYISAERELNNIFEHSDVDSAQVDSLISKIGMLHAKIRATHVQAHLKMEKLLSGQQIDRYQELRGYRDERHQHQMGND
ncbi:hypothetical protein [Fodinibius sp. Rm-B-1B1-1]|uniref:Spy/CpxP family protein refolding chaperone n=1 Tax=Fodinibius alkaliphilus TaxID=3140241 RepID=UPI00315B0FB4